MGIKLNGIQKAAFFVMSLNPKISKELMKKLSVKEKEIVKRAISQLKKASLPIYLKMWEAFKSDVEQSPACKTPWPEKDQEKMSTHS